MSPFLLKVCFRPPKCPFKALFDVIYYVLKNLVLWARSEILGSAENLKSA